MTQLLAGRLWIYEEGVAQTFGNVRACNISTHVVHTMYHPPNVSFRSSESKISDVHSSLLEGMSLQHDEFVQLSEEENNIKRAIPQFFY